MRSILQSLAWKEWHEHKWKLAAIAAVLIGATSLSMLVEERDKLGLAFGMMFMCVIPLAVFVGLGAAANERSRNTLAFLQAQPVPLWHVGIVKLILSLLTVFVPVVLTTWSIFAWSWIFDFLGIEYSKRAMGGETGGIHTGNFFVDTAIFSALLAVSLVIWTAAVGVNRKDEVSAGAIALTIILGWMVIIWVFCWFLVQAGVDLYDWGTTAALSLTPIGIGAIFGSPLTAPEIAFGFCIVTIVHLLLAAFYVRRFGQTMERPVVSPKVALRDTRRIDWLDSPRRSPLTAVMWKQFRESVPIALAGLAGIVGTAIVIYTADQGVSGFAFVYFRTAVPLGFCISLVVGIGVALQDVGPRLNTFWRSRPIDGSLWFWTKYVTGLLVVVAVIYLPQLILAGGSDYAHDPEAIVTVPIMHVATYAAAVAMTCLTRHAVYAAILSFGTLPACVVAAWLVWMTPDWIGWRASTSDGTVYLGETIEQPVVVFMGMLGCLVMSTVVGWLAMRNDWGWKSRY